MNDQPRTPGQTEDAQAQYAREHAALADPNKHAQPNQDIPDSSHDHSTLYGPASPDTAPTTPSEQPSPAMGSGGIVGTVAQDFGPTGEDTVDAEYKTPEFEGFLSSKEMKSAQGKKY